MNQCAIFSLCIGALSVHLGLVSTPEEQTIKEKLQLYTILYDMLHHVSVSTIMFIVNL